MRTRPTRRLAAAAIAAALALPMTVSQAVAAPTGEWPTWDGTATGQFRSATIDDGEFIYSNGIHLNKGGNVDMLEQEDYYYALIAPFGPRENLKNDDRDDLYRHATWGAFGADRDATNGDYELPTDKSAYPDFTADLAELRMQTDADELFVYLRYTSMPAPDTQIATLAIAGSAATDRDWPHNAAASSPWDVALTTWGTDATVTVADATPIDIAAAGGQVRTGDHTVELRVPLTLLPAGPWTLTGGAGLTDPSDVTQYLAVPRGSPSAAAPGSGSSLFTGSNVWTLLFADDDPWVFAEKAQSALLVAGDVGAANAVVDPSELSPGFTNVTPLRTGWLSRYYSSAFDFGDGISRGGSSPVPSQAPPEIVGGDAAVSYEYTGRLQPYAMYVPQTYVSRPGPAPLVIYLHGLNNYYYEPYGVVTTIEDHLEEGGYLLAGLLGRGDLSYLGRGELDVREVLADVRANYDVDPDRIYIMGHSMGSIGSHNFATRNPDLIAAMSPSQIPASQSLAANLRHIPWLLATGTGDPLDGFGSTSQGMYDRMSALGYQATLVSYVLKTHEASATYDTLTRTFELYDASRRVTDPSEVIYLRPANDDYPDLGIIHDGAYWVSKMTFVDPDAAQQVRAVSGAIPDPPLDPEAATRSQATINDDVPSGRGQAALYVTEPAFGPVPTPTNDLTLDIVNVASLAIDAAAAQLSLSDVLTITTTSDVASELTLTGLTDVTRRFSIDGGVVGQVTPSSGALTLTIPAGDHVLVLDSAGAAPTEPPAAPLPTTGGGLAMAGLLAVGAAMARRRSRS